MTKLAGRKVNSHNLRQTNRLDPSLRAAAMEGECLKQHAVMFTTNGWRFCPWCGNELKIIARCEQCGGRFLSEAAFHVHRGGHLAFYKSNRCPYAEENEQHIVRYRVNRNRMFCVNCNREYPVKNELDHLKGLNAQANTKQ